MRKIPIVLLRWFSTVDCRKNPDCLFVFGDNFVRKGYSGQAVIRGELNAFGFATKFFPSLKPHAFFSDDKESQTIVKKEQERLKQRLKTEQYKILYLPADGLGTGLAKLPTKAPIIFQQLNLLFYGNDYFYY